MSLETRILPDFSAVDSRQWSQLTRAGNPFLEHTFLAALESTGSIGPHSGWHPHHLAVFDGEELLAFAPTYAKTNSHGEFVFDWAWADAFHRNGLQYYPKLLTGIPYSPISGPRLLVRADREDASHLKSMLVDYALRLCREKGYSSWHCNFVIGDDYSPLAQQPLLRRRDWQFHWRNKEYGCFDGFLADLRSRKRKSIRRERRQVQQAGIQVQWKSGLEIDAADLDFVYDCYIGTFHNYGNYPALKKRFFEIIGQELGEGFQVALASRDGQQVAAAVFLAGGGRLYGRYWGCMEDVPGLHFELAYYQGIDFCIRNGLQVFESGAQGEHKIARGFLPTRTRSFHHIEHPGFRQAIDEHLHREKSWLDEYRHQLDALSPFRRDDT